MDHNQAEAIVNAVRNPDPKIQAEQRRKEDAESRGLIISRFTTSFVLLGFVIGMIAAYVLDQRFSLGGLSGSIGGAVVGQVVGTWRARRRAA